MVGLLLIGAAVAFAVLVAAAVRASSLVTALLAGYLALVGNVGVVTWALSPLHEVTRGGLAVAEGVLLAAAAGAWWLRGRPGLPLASAGAATGRILSDPVTAAFLLAVGVLLGYELMLGLAVPPNNGDALAYHLTRAAAWAQHGGLYWIPNAPTVRLNVFQPLAEQQLLFLLVATGGGALIALPQFFAQLAILVAVYGAARRLGFEVRASTCAALLFATFSLVALEATTAQNDLVAASFPAAAACLLLGSGRLDPALGGIAIAFGLGAKLDTALVLPVLAWLALARGRRTTGWAAAGALAGMLTVGMWSYILNIIGSGHLLGAGTGTEVGHASPSYPRSVSTAFRVLYGSMDLSVLSNRLIYVLALAGGLAAIGAAAWTLRRADARRAGTTAAGVATPFLAPLLVLGASGLIAFVADRWGFPIRGPNGITHFIDSDLNETWTRISNENYSAFGPVGIAALLVASALTLYSYARNRADARQLALAAAFPLFLIVVSAETTFGVWLVRYLIVPVVLTAPLLARLFSGRAATAAWATVAVLTVGLTIAHDQAKPLRSHYGYGPPWELTQLTALATNSRSDYAGALAAYDRIVPDHACIGAVVGGQEPSYFLYGTRLQHHVAYLSVYDAANAALRHNLFYVVISTGPNRWAADGFRKAGWTIRPLGSYWQLASAPHAAGGSCGA